jgi:hypothetical protein
MNLSYFEKYLLTDDFQYYQNLLKLGIYEYKSMSSLIQYMMPEILIISFIMLNEIQLKLLGLFYEIE